MKEVRFLRDGKTCVVNDYQAGYLVRDGVVEVVKDLGSYQSPNAILTRKIERFFRYAKRFQKELSHDEKVAIIKNVKKILKVKEQV